MNRTRPTESDRRLRPSRRFRYAPKLLGVYQIDIEIPPDWPDGRFYLDCTG